ncbi:MAG: hypothetical protein AAGH68_16605 [Pseudomonadota bacterium]
MVELRTRFLLTSALLVGVQVISGCEGQFPLEAGYSNVRAELDRTKPYHVVALSEDRAVISAKGRQVAIEPAKGFCLAEDSVEASARSAFALIGDCALDKAPDKSKRSARGELKLPPSVPGIITVSVSGNPKFDGSNGLDGLEGFLKTPAGKKLLGRGADSSAVKVKETRQMSEGVYVLVEDKGDDVLPVLSKRFWRGFVEVNDRLAVVTVSGFRANPLGKEEMLGHLVDQVKTLAVANRDPVNEPYQSRTLLASRSRSAPAPESRVEAGPVALSDLKPEALEVVVVETTEPAKVPLPQQRPDLPEEAEVEETTELASEKEDATEKLAAAVPAPKPEETAEVPAEAETAPAEVAAVEPAEEQTADAAPQSPEPVTLVNPAVRQALDEEADNAGTETLATAQQAVTPIARPGQSEDSNAAPATRFAPKRAPSAPKRPAV